MKKVAVATTASRGTLVNSSRATAVQSVYIQSAINPDHSLRRMRRSADRLGMRSLGMGIALGMVALIRPVSAGGLETIQPVLRACFSTGDPTRCDQALDLTEQLQRRAARADRYPCQTLLLGLQADVVMIQLSQGRGQRVFDTLQASARACRGL